MNIRHIWRINAIAGFAAILIACGPASTNENLSANQAPKTPPVPAATVDELASGKKAYETNCMICHKSDGTGGKVSIEGENLNVEDLTTKKIKGFSDEKMISYIMNGIEEEGMPSFKRKLSEGEMRDVVRYIRTELQHAEVHTK
jgi:mono/diheme cytochrome c family protein